MLAKLKDKYNNMSIITKASIWFVFCTMLQKGIAFLTVPIFTRIMPASEYGLYSTYLSWYSIVTILCTLDMHNCIYMNKISKAQNDDEKNKVAIPMLSLSSVITIIIFIIYLIFHNYINSIVGLPTCMICLMFLQIFFDPVINFWIVKQRFDYNYKKIVLRTCFMVGLNAILGIVFVLIVNSNKAIARAISIVLVQLIFGIIFYFYFFRRTKKLFSNNEWLHILNVQLPLLPHSLSLTVLSSADRIMINSIIGSTEAAIYSVAYSSAYVVNVLKNSIVDAVRPEIYKCIKNKNYTKINYLFKNLLIIILLIVFLFIIFGPEIIRIMAPSNYYEAIYIIPPVAASTFFTFLYCMFSCISFYYEKTKSIMYASIGAAILNLILNAICIPIYGYLAAGYTTLICYMFLSVVHYFIMNKICKKELDNVRIFNAKLIVSISIGLIIVTLLLTYIYSYIYIRYIILIIVLLVSILKRKEIIGLYKKIKEK